jgi:hypothetical protein
VHLPTPTYSQVNDGVQVSRANLKPGDIIFFNTGGINSHDGIYIGNGKFIQAPHTGAEGEFQAAERLKDAAAVISEQPVALQLRYLQTLLELGSSQSTTIVFPVDLISPFLERAGDNS